MVGFPLQVGLVWKVGLCQGTAEIHRRKISYKRLRDIILNFPLLKVDIYGRCGKKCDARGRRSDSVCAKHISEVKSRNLLLIIFSSIVPLVRLPKHGPMAPPLSINKGNELSHSFVAKMHCYSGYHFHWPLITFCF